MSSFRFSILLLPLAVSLALLTGACGAPIAVTAGSYAADGTLMATGNKTSSDHLASMMSKKDCSFVRVFRSTDVCKERDGATDPYAVDYNEPQRMASEDGTSYGPPLRASADAPATSWDASAYKAAPASPSPAPIEPVTAVADAAPAPTPASAAPATATPKPKKSKAVRAAKKPSRGQAAPAS